MPHGEGGTSLLTTKLRGYNKYINYRILMEVFSVTEFQERWDELIERVENGETLGIVNDNGDSAVMMPADDPVYQMYKDHYEAS